MSLDSRQRVGPRGEPLLDAPRQMVPVRLPIRLPAFVFGGYLFDE
jgi:hypothetical protein